MIIETSQEHYSISFIQTSHNQTSFKLQPFLCLTLHLHILLSVSVDLQFPLRVLHWPAFANETRGLQDGL